MNKNVNIGADSTTMWTAFDHVRDGASGISDGVDSHHGLLHALQLGDTP